MADSKGKKRRFSSLWILNALLILFLLALVLVHPIDPIRDYTVRREGFEETELWDDGTVLRRTFESPRDADTMELPVRNGVLNAYGGITVTLKDGQGETLQAWELSKLEMNRRAQGKDGWIGFRVKDGIRKDVPYTVEIRAPGLDAEHYVLFGMEGDGVPALAVCAERTNGFFIAAAAVLFLTANFWWFTRKKDIRKTCFPILLGLGLIMTLIMAPGSQPDEEYHYCSAYKLSSIMMGVKENVNAVEPGMYGGFPQHRNLNDSFLKTGNDLFGAGRVPNEVTMLGRSDELGAPVVYFAPAIGITAVRLLGGNEAQAYAAARLCTMLSYVGLCVIAIRLTPRRRELMLLICAVPMAMHMAASTSRDAFVNGMALVYMAYMFRIIADRKALTWPRLLGATGLLCLFGPAKVLHCLLALMILLVPKDLFRSGKDRWIKIGAMFLCIGAILAATQAREIWKTLTHSNYMGRADYYHVDFVWTNPLDYLRLLLGSVESDAWFYIRESMGQRLAGLTLPVAEYLPVAYLLVMGVAAFAKEDEPDFLGRGQKTALLACCALGYLAMAAAFSFKDTVYGSTLIAGIQGRYLLTFAVPLFYGIRTRKVTVETEGYRMIYPVWFIEAGFIVYAMSQIVV